MPNWVRCAVEFDDEKDFVRAGELVAGKDEDGADTEFSFQSIVPMPEGLLDGDGWYEWRIANWGTKWDACEVATDLTAHMFTFSTACGAPFPVIRKLSEILGCTIRMCYAEETMHDDGAGEYVCKDGKCIREADLARDTIAQLWGYGCWEDYEEEDERGSGATGDRPPRPVVPTAVGRSGAGGRMPPVPAASSVVVIVPRWVPPSFVRELKHLNITIV